MDNNTGTAIEEKKPQDITDNDLEIKASKPEEIDVEFSSKDEKLRNQQKTRHFKIKKLEYEKQNLLAIYSEVLSAYALAPTTITQPKNLQNSELKVKTSDISNDQEMVRNQPANVQVESMKQRERVSIPQKINEDRTSSDTNQNPRSVRETPSTEKANKDTTSGNSSTSKEGNSIGSGGKSGGASERKSVHSSENASMGRSAQSENRHQQPSHPEDDFRHQPKKINQAEENEMKKPAVEVEEVPNPMKEKLARYVEVINFKIDDTQKKLSLLIDEENEYNNKQEMLQRFAMQAHQHN